MEPILQTKYCVPRPYWLWLGKGRSARAMLVWKLQLPPSLLREKKKRKRKETDRVQGYETDTEEPEGKEPVQKKLTRHK